jgi:hypothetical protein
MSEYPEESGQIRNPQSEMSEHPEFGLAGQVTSETLWIWDLKTLAIGRIRNKFEIRNPKFEIQ